MTDNDNSTKLNISIDKLIETLKKAMNSEDVKVTFDDRETENNYILDLTNAFKKELLKIPEKKNNDTA